MREQVPSEAMGLSPYEGKYITDRPLLVKSCKRCSQPVQYKLIPSGKQERLYCSACKKFRGFHQTKWLPHYSRIRFVTDAEYMNLIEIARREAKD